VLAPFYCDEVDVVLLSELQIEDGFFVEAGRGFYAGEAVAGSEIDFFADLRGDKLIGPPLGGLDLAGKSHPWRQGFW
jgi:hypothetical protein